MQLNAPLNIFATFKKVNNHLPVTAYVTMYPSPASKYCCKSPNMSVQELSRICLCNTYSVKRNIVN